MPSHGPPYRVFISRTDEAALAPYAAEAVRIVRTLDWHPIDFHDWGARSQTSFEACRHEVERCDILIVLVAYRYGWIPPEGDGETSITRWEVRWATDAKLDLLAYIAAPSVLWPVDQVDRDALAAKRLAAFKAELEAGHVVEYFESVDRFGARLAVDLARLASASPTETATPAARVTSPPATPPQASSYTYKTLKITIATAGSGGEVAVVTESPPGVVAPEPCALDRSVGDAVNVFWSSATGTIAEPVRRAQAQATSVAVPLPSADAVARIGERLYGALLGPELQACFEQARRAVDPQRQEGLRVVLEIPESSPLAEVPWEFLRDPARRDFLFTDPHTPLVRWLRVDQPTPSLNVTPPLRLLLVTAAPSDQAGFREAEELAMLSERLEALRVAGRVQIHRLEGATREQLYLAVDRHKPHILHFIGHGAVKNDEGCIVLEKPPGRQSDYVTGEKLAVRLRPQLKSLRLVFLNSCVTAAVSRRSPFGGVAQNLVRRGVPAVVAMQFPIGDTPAVALAEHFYRYVADGWPIDASLTSARASLYATDHDVEWGAAVLYMQTSDGQLFKGLGVESVRVTPPAPSATTGEDPVVTLPDAAAAAPPVRSSGPFAVRPLSWGWARVAGIAAGVLLVVALFGMPFLRQADHGSSTDASSSQPPRNDPDVLASPPPSAPPLSGHTPPVPPRPDEAAEADRALRAAEAALERLSLARTGAVMDAKLALAELDAANTDEQYALALARLRRAEEAMQGVSRQMTDAHVAVQMAEDAVAALPRTSRFEELHTRSKALGVLFGQQTFGWEAAAEARRQDTERIAERRAAQQLELARQADAERAREEAIEAARLDAERRAQEATQRARELSLAEVRQTVTGARDAAAVEWLATHPNELAMFRQIIARFDESKRDPDSVSLLLHLPSGTPAPGFPTSISPRALVQIVAVIPAVGAPLYDSALVEAGCDVKPGPVLVTVGSMTTSLASSGAGTSGYRLARIGTPFVCPTQLRYSLDVRPTVDVLAQHFEMSLPVRPLRHVRPTVVAGVDLLRHSTISVAQGSIQETSTARTADLLAGATYHVNGFDAGDMRWFNYIANPFVAVSLRSPTERLVVGTSIMHRSGVSLNLGVAFNRVASLPGIMPATPVAGSGDIAGEKRWKTGAFIGVGVSLPLDVRRR